MVNQFEKPVNLRGPYIEAGLAALEISEDHLEILARNEATWLHVIPCTCCTIGRSNNVVIFNTTQATQLVVADAPAGSPPSQHTVYMPLIRR